MLAGVAKPALQTAPGGDGARDTPTPPSAVALPPAAAPVTATAPPAQANQPAIPPGEPKPMETAQTKSAQPKSAAQAPHLQLSLPRPLVHPAAGNKRAEARRNSAEGKCGAGPHS